MEPVHDDEHPFQCWCLPRVMKTAFGYAVFHRRWGTYCRDGLL